MISHSLLHGHHPMVGTHCLHLQGLFLATRTKYYHEYASTILRMQLRKVRQRITPKRKHIHRCFSIWTERL